MERKKESWRERKRVGEKESELERKKESWRERKRVREREIEKEKKRLRGKEIELEGVKRNRER